MTSRAGSCAVASRLVVPNPPTLPQCHTWAARLIPVDEFRFVRVADHSAEPIQWPMQALFGPIPTHPHPPLKPFNATRLARLTSRPYARRVGPIGTPRPLLRPSIPRPSPPGQWDPTA